ncbi:TRAP transporter substrate-binding protein [uncultured Marivita sp.]|uniref:TRAP transporter substrate-binding protein n=1 Tax=uncultured Marivita sp. TaxID=888080 RepID=UPI002617FDB4|nr:TRAP transporter substrate-binding protein [uncultured Marivita sp.]
MKTFILTTAVAALAATGALSQDFELRFQSSDPAGNPNFELQQQWTEMVSEMSDGRVSVELLPVESIVAHTETQDAIAAGLLDGHITDTSYFAGKDPAFGLIANPVGAWSAPEEMFAFMREGPGGEMMDGLLEPYGLKFLGATTPGLEAFVSDVPLDGVADLEGLRMRAPEGLVQQVFAAAGAAPVNLPGSEVFTSLDKGVIDAADYSVFSTNQAQGLHDVASHPVYPGFHSMPLVEVSMNRERFNEMPEDLQQVMIESVEAFADMQVAALREADEAAVAEAEASGSVTVHDWPAEERAAFRSIAMGEWETVADGSENAKMVFDTLTGYLRENGLISE